jgi:sugar (pentulose or hexulose) kinase
VDLPGAALYATMNRLAGEAPCGAGGLQCQPTFTGTRADPTVRGSITGLTPQNFTAARLIRAVLEGMAHGYRQANEQIVALAAARHQRVAAAGNGLRANPLLVSIVGDAMGMPVSMAIHREEAAFGAVLVAAVGSGICRDLDQAARLVRYVDESGS